MFCVFGFNGNPTGQIDVTQKGVLLPFKRLSHSSIFVSRSSIGMNNREAEPPCSREALAVRFEQGISTIRSSAAVISKNLLSML